MSAEITTLQVINSDISVLTITNDISNVSVISDITSVSLQNNDISILTQTSGTINLASLSLATTVTDIGRAGVVGVSQLAARADHVHSAANLLLDGGNY
jgi:hypothetical protein